MGKIYHIGLMMLGMACPMFAEETPFLDPMFGIVDLDGAQLMASSPNNNIIYGSGAINGSAAGEMDLELDLYHPAGPGLPALLPGVVFIHGGGFSTGNKEDFAMRTLAMEYARRGYIAASIGYRLNGVNPDEGNPTAAVNDATKALQWMIAQAVPGGATEKLMTDKIALGGGSAGAITSLMQGCANVTGAKPKAILNFWGALLGNDGNFLDATSPATPIEASDPPVFTVHGTGDTDVPFDNATNLCTRLDQAGINIPYKLFTLAGQPHAPWSTVFTPLVDGKTILQHSVEFNYDHLDLGPPPSSTDHAGPSSQPRIRYSGQQLVIHWKGQPGKVYELVSNVHLDAPPASWPVYSETITGGQTVLYGNIPSGGNSTVVMTPHTPPAESTRFFAVGETSN